jgi:hypothetical protein
VSIHAQALAVSLVFASMLSAPAFATHSESRSVTHAPRAAGAMRVDGIADEADWDRAAWRDINYRWLGPDYTPEDFEGRFKLVWTPERLYLLVEITDDILFDSHRHPLVQYWDDDCLEVFVDEDYSGGDHQFNHNAFAYHFSLDNRAIDIGTDEQARDYSHHVQSRWRQEGNKVIWEVAIDVYDDTYDDNASDNEPLTLEDGKVLGLMVAWCDNDGSELRENFIGSESVPAGPKDRGWIVAGLFGKVVLHE